MGLSRRAYAMREKVAAIFGKYTQIFGKYNIPHMFKFLLMGCGIIKFGASGIVGKITSLVVWLDQQLFDLGKFSPPL